MFFFKKSKITVDAFTNSSAVLDFFPIAKSSNFLPKWYKSLPNFYSSKIGHDIDINLPTMKSCDGFRSLYSKGFIIPLWADLILKTYKNNSWEYQSSDKILTVTSHDSDQFGSEFNEFQHIKIMSPWILKEKSNVKFLLSNPVFNTLSKYKDVNILPGILDFTFQNNSHVNIFIQKNQQIKLDAGTPIAQFIPLTDRKIDLKLHLLDDQEYSKLHDHTNYGLSFMNRYKKKKLFKNAKKCPFEP